MVENVSKTRVALLDIILVIIFNRSQTKKIVTLAFLSRIKKVFFIPNRLLFRSLWLELMVL